MNSINTNNPNFQELNINNETDQIDKINKMNQISLQTKIKLNLDNSKYKYLNLKDGTFIIYTEKEILLFNKNQNYIKLFPSNNEKKKKDIKFVKYLNKEKIIFLNQYDLYISTIKSKRIFSSTIIKFKRDQNVLDVIELKNGMILAITREDILEIKINDNKYEICRLSENPIKDNKFLLSNETFGEERDIFKLSSYELPKNNILISLVLVRFELSGTHCTFIKNHYRTEEVIFNLDKFKIIKNLKNYISTYDFEESFKPYLIKIYNKYICISKKNNIYIYDIANYELIKELNFNFNINTFNFDENIILVSKENEFSFILYDLSDINYIKYQKLYLINDKKVLKIKENDIFEINKYSEGKMVVNLPEKLFIFDFTKYLQLLIPSKITK